MSEPTDVFEPTGSDGELPVRVTALSASACLRSGFGIYLNGLGPFMLWSLLFHAPFAALALGLWGNEPADTWLVAGLFAATTMLPVLVEAGIFYGVVKTLAGQRVSIRRSMWIGLAHAPMAFLVAAVVAAFVALGVYSYLVPGLLVAIIMWVAVPAAVVEGTGVFASMGRSDRLTNGHRMPILSMVLALWALDGVLGWLTYEFATSSFSTATATPLIAWSFALSVILAPLSACVVGVGYTTLRRIKDDIGPHSIAAMFD